MSEPTQWVVEEPKNHPAEALGIRELLHFFFNNVFLLLGGIVLGIGFGLLAQKILPAVYESKGKFLLDDLPFVKSNDKGDAETERQLVQTLILSIPGRDMRAAIAGRLGISPGRLAFVGVDPPLPMSSPEPTANIEVKAERNSRIGVVTVNSHSSEFAASVANALLEELDLYNIVGGRLRELRLNLTVATSKSDSLLKQRVSAEMTQTNLAQENNELSEYARRKLPLESFPAFATDATLNNLKTQLVLVDSEYDRISSTSIRGTRLVGKKAELVGLREQIAAHANSLAQALKSQLEITTTQEANLQRELQSSQDAIRTMHETSARLIQAFGDPAAMRKILGEDPNSSVATGNVVVVVDRAVAALKPVSPKLALNLMLGALFGSMIGGGAAAMRTLLDNRLSSASRVEALTGQTCLAMVGRPTGSARRRTKNASSLQHPVDSASLGFLSSRLLMARKDDHALFQIVGFTPSGKSTAASRLVTDLAILLAQAERRTLVVDLHFRDPRQHNFLAISVKKGLVEWMGSEDGLQDYICYSAVRELALLSCAQPSSDAEELLSRRPLAPALAALEGQWDFILIDSPCILTDWSLMLSLPPGSPLIIAADFKRTSGLDVTRTVSHARGPGWLAAGVVLQNCPESALKRR